MSRGPKILVLGPTPPPWNGMATATRNILRTTLVRQFSIIHLDTADRRGLSNVGKVDLTNIYLALSHSVQFLRLLFDKRPDVVYIPISQSALGFLRDCMFLIPARLTNHKVIVHLHGGYFRQFYMSSPFWLRFLVRWTLCNVRRTIVLGESLRPVFYGLVPKERIVVIPNGVDPTPYLKGATAADECSLRLQVLYLSTLMKSKGLMDILLAISYVVDRIPEARFTLAGEFYNNSEAEEVYQLISAKGLWDRVELPGVVVGEEKAQLFLNSDIFVFPTRYPYEGHPFVILEAMAAGLPVITTNRGAIKETVLEGVNGYIVPEGDPEAIAKKILLLLQNKDLRRQMGQASRERFLMHYTLERWTEKMARVFQDVLGED